MRRVQQAQRLFSSAAARSNNKHKAQQITRRLFNNGAAAPLFHGAIKQQPHEAVEQLYHHNPEEAAAAKDHHHHDHDHHHHDHDHDHHHQHLDHDHLEHQHHHGENAASEAVESIVTTSDKIISGTESDPVEAQPKQQSANVARRVRALRAKTNDEKINLLEPYFGFKLEPAETYPKLEKDVIKRVLQMDDPLAEKSLFDMANLITERFYNNHVFFRGIIEFSNVCQKNCNYCGIRKEMKGLHRYTMSREEMIETAVWAHKSQIGSIMFQSGELVTDKRIDFLCSVIKEIKETTGQNGLGVSLSLGELSREQYAKLMEAGAHRYLLRIESANPKLYSMLHPNDGNHVWETRRNCLLTLKDLGYQIGTGIMIQLPFQTYDDLAGDIQFFKQIGTDMIGMGPYIVQKDTPLGKIWMDQMQGKGLISSSDTEPSILAEYLRKYQSNGTAPFDKALYNKHLFRLSLKMIALSRIVNGPVNIAATTALQAIHPAGREISLNCGANMVMPIITPQKYRADYQLYEGKPCIDDDREECRSCLTKRLKWAGKDLIKNKWGDPLTAKGRSKVYNE